MIRGRFAPTPSGLMHLGNARTALLAWLQARKGGGAFLLRLEDIDKPRAKAEYARQIIADLRWLGLDWDEGPDIGGTFGPYTQSKRLALYEAALDQLERAGLIYPCFCSRAELAAIARAPHGLAAEGPAYTGVCRHLTEAARQLKRARKQPSLRFIMPDYPISFTDLVMGKRHFSAGAGGDFIVKRADGMFAYQLAVVVDDAAMGITDVLRGADLLDSTPRQIALYQALGLRQPRFAHIPLLLGEDHKRLSKRHRSATLKSLREAGISAEEVVGYLAYVSGLIDRPEKVRAIELLDAFAINRIPVEPVIVHHFSVSNA
ncbi:MAG TPA: tRNA glutamyl-Q(34) synthetase GluQRS [Bacilli bacterium]